MKLLFLEDNPGDVRLILLMLQEAPSKRFEIHHVKRLSEALPRLQEESFDAILSDLGLPDSQGLDTLIALREQAPFLPIVVLTGNDDEAMGVAAVQAGAQDYLVKGNITTDLLVKSLNFAVERKRGEQTILEERNRAAFFKDLLVHDINNINHGLLFHLKRLLKDDSLGDKQKEGVSTCLSLVEKIAQLITNVHLLSEIDKGDLNLEAVDFKSVLNACVEKVKQMFIQSKEVEIHQHLPEEPIFIRGNYLLDTVVTNILINAVKYNRQPVATIWVEVHATEDGRYFKVEFKDNGIGIPDSAKSAMFRKSERFNGDTSSGLGIGLTLVKKVVEGYGGKIWLEDRVKGDFTQGSNFVLLLPKA